MITEADLKSADAVILAIDTNIDKSRFQGLTSGRGICEGCHPKMRKVSITKALAAKPVSARVEYPEENNGNGGKSKSGIYKHLMTGVSFMIPFVVAGGLLIAFSFAFGIHAADEEGTLAAALMTIGGSAFGLMVPILAGYIAYSIADRPGIVPGMVGGIIANTLGTGFLVGLLAGFLAGYVILAIRKVIKLPKSFEGLMPVLILPVISTLVVGLILIFVLGGPVKSINDAMLAWLDGMSGANAVVLGGILGIMMAADMGGTVSTKRLIHLVRRP